LTMALPRRFVGGRAARPSRCFRTPSSVTQSLIVLLSIVALYGSELVSAELTKSFSLYHSLDGGSDFQRRGSITLTSTPTGIETKVEEDESCLDITLINSMVSEGGLYRLKVVDQDGSTTLTSVPGCNLRRANFREEITLMLSNTGKLLSVSYMPIVSPLAPACNTLSPIEADTSKDLKFQTTVDFETATPGMAIPLVLPQTKPPVGLKFFPRKDVGKMEHGAGSVPLLNPEAQDSKQNQSFFVKYWYIVLPLTIMTMFNGAGTEEAPTGEGGAPAAGAVPVAAAAAGVAAAAGGAKPRRGKRG